MFKITGGKGFHITFANEYTVSVQFGGGNYGDNYDDEISTDGNIQSGKHGSSTAEVGIWNKDGELIAHPDFEGNSVKGWLSADDVLELMNWAARQEEVK